MSEKFYRDKVASIKKAQGTAETALAKAHTAAAKYRSEAAKQRAMQARSETVRGAPPRRGRVAVATGLDTLPLRGLSQ